MRALKILVVAMGVLLVLGVAVVIATIAYRVIHASTSTAAGTPPPASRGFGSASVSLPPGARVVEMRGVGAKLVLRVERPDGTEALLVIDAETGNALGTIELQPGR